MDKDHPISSITTTDAIVDERLENRNLQMTLLGVFAGLALLLASLGIYGVLSYLVNQRVREIGLRMALGASRGQGARMFVAHGLGLPGAGFVIGVLVSLLAGRAMRVMLYEVAPTDVRT